VLATTSARFALLAFSSLFSVINPISAAPLLMILIGQTQHGIERVALGAAITANIVLTFLIFLVAPGIVARVGATGQKIAEKIMGLITAVIGIQFMINGITAVVRDIVKNLPA
jgi:small neutral amino acid transporter SnatA (MarC family)